LHSASNWLPPNAPSKVEKAIDRFETTTTKAFEKSWKRAHIENLSQTKIDLLKKITTERKYIVVASDKNLGPCIIEIKQYINRCLTDHLNCQNSKLD
jgi:hypothetical protein